MTRLKTIWYDGADPDADYFVCNWCGYDIAFTAEFDMFTCEERTDHNLGFIVHEVFTVILDEAVQFQPPYTFVNVYCRQCHYHLGWRHIQVQGLTFQLQMVTLQRVVEAELEEDNEMVEEGEPEAEVIENEEAAQVEEEQAEVVEEDAAAEVAEDDAAAEVVEEAFEF